MNYKTFASHASRDRLSGKNMQSFFDQLASRIVVLGGTSGKQPAMFVDHQNIQSGAPWSQDLGDALARCESYFFMLSPSFMSSPWCGKEVGVAYARYSSPGRPTQGRYLFPMKWEVSPLPTMGGGSGIPVPLNQFQHRPTGLSVATVRDYEKLGLSPMMAQSKRYKEKVIELIDKLAREIITGTNHGLLPLHPPITDMDDVHAPPGWAGAGVHLPLDVQHHLCIAPGTTFAAGGGELQMRRVMQGAFELMQARAAPLDVRAKGLSGRIKQAAKGGQILLVIADAVAGHDRVMKAINACKQKPRLALLLLDTESGNTTSPVPEQWLTAKNLATGCFSQAFVSGHLKVTTPSALAADMEWLLQKVRGEAIESSSVVAAQDANAVTSAENSGIRIGIRPVVSGPTRKQ